MAGQFDTRPSRVSAPLLASTLVLLTGALGATVIFAFGGGDPWIGLLVFGCGVGLVLCLGWLFTAATKVTSSSAYGWVFSKEARPAPAYLPKTRRPGGSSYGTNRPPSVEDLRELKEGLHNWVPSNGSRRRSIRND